MLEVCQEEMKSIIFFGIDKDDMVEVTEKMEKRFEDGKMVPGTRSSLHFIPQSASQTEHKLRVDIHDSKIPTRVDIGDIAPSSYISFECSLLWWLGLVNKVDKDAPDEVMYNSCTPHGPLKSFNWPQGGDNSYVPIENTVCAIRHLQQPLEELTEFVMKIMTKRLLRLQNFICQQLLI